MHYSLQTCFRVLAVSLSRALQASLIFCLPVKDVNKYTSRDRLPSDSMGGRWQSHSGRSTFVGRSSMAFGLRCIPRHSFLNRFPEVASMPWVDALCIPWIQHSGQVLSCCARRLEVWGGEWALQTVWSKKGCTPTRNKRVSNKLWLHSLQSNSQVSFCSDNNVRGQKCFKQAIYTENESGDFEKNIVSHLSLLIICHCVLVSPCWVCFLRIFKIQNCK